MRPSKPSSIEHIARTDTTNPRCSTSHDAAPVIAPTWSMVASPPGGTRLRERSVYGSLDLGVMRHVQLSIRRDLDDVDATRACRIRYRR